MARGKKANTQPESQQERSQAASGLPLAHRLAFLQIVMERGWLSAAEAKTIFAKLDKLSGGGASLTHTIADINFELSSLLLSIKQLRYVVDGLGYIAFINKENDEIAKQNGTSFTVPQVQFLRGVIEAIATDPEADQGIGTISGISALNINYRDASQATQASQSAKNRLSMNEKETVLKSFVKEGWLADAPEMPGHYTLGVRAFMELDEQLLSFDLPDETRQVWEQFL